MVKTSTLEFGSDTIQPLIVIEYSVAPFWRAGSVSYDPRGQE